MRAVVSRPPTPAVTPLAVALSLVVSLLTLGLVAATPAVADTSLDGQHQAATWPAYFNDYRYARDYQGGVAIGDINRDENPFSADVASGACPTTLCIGDKASVAWANDGTNIFFRLRLGADPADNKKGGLFNGAYLVQVYVNDQLAAVVGVDGKQSTNDYVYVTDKVGGTVKKIYQFPWGNTAANPYATEPTGMRVLSTADRTDQYWLDWQVPISELKAVSGGAITDEADLKLYFGTSQAANLAVINKDYMIPGATGPDVTKVQKVNLKPAGLTMTSSVAYKSGASPGTTGQISTYTGTLKVCNPGGQPTTDTVLTATIPQGVTYLDGSSVAQQGTVIVKENADGTSTVTWTVGTLDPLGCFAATLDLQIKPTRAQAGDGVVLLDNITVTGFDKAWTKTLTAGPQQLRTGSIVQGNGQTLADNDYTSTLVDAAVDIDVLANDVDPEGDPLTITQIGPTANGGIVTDLGGGKLSYEPAAGYSGPDTFSYTVCDNHSPTPSCDTAQVGISVLANNTDPVGVADNAITDWNTPISIPVLNNDTDNEGDPLIAQSPKLLTLVDGVPLGSVKIVDNELVWTPPQSWPAGQQFPTTIEMEYDACQAGDTSSCTLSPVKVFLKVEYPMAPNLELTKSTADPTVAGATAAPPYQVGETLTWYLTIKNAGNTLLNDPSVTDPGVTLVGCHRATSSGWGVTDLTTLDLAPGDTVYCKLSQTITQLAVDKGAIVNTATVDATASNAHVGGTTTYPYAEKATGEISGPVHAPALSVDKVADKSYLVAGETINYTITVTNTGNVTMHGVAVTDPMFPGDQLVCTTTGTSATGGYVLAPATTAGGNDGQSVTCTGSHLTTQADVDAGALINMARTKGLSPLDNPVEGTDSITVSGPVANPSIQLTKTVKQQSFVAGDTLDYTFVVLNNGNSTLRKVTVTDALIGGSQASAVSCDAPDGNGQFTLLPDDTVTCTASYVATAADEATGSIQNTAKVTSTSPAGKAIKASDSVTLVNPAAAEPILTLTKTASPATFTKVGDTLTYTLQATNASVGTPVPSIDNVQITDPGLAGLSPLSCDKANDGSLSLAGGESLTCTATYVTKQSDLDAGAIQNAAAVTGQVGDQEISGGDSVTVSGPERLPELTMDKTVLGGFTPPYKLGQQLSYRFAVTNTGNVTVFDPQVIDDSVKGVSPVTNCLINSVEVSNTGQVANPDGLPRAVLAPGETMYCNAKYRVGQKDIDAGSISNTATVTGFTITGDDVSTGDTINLLGPAAAPALKFTKVANRQTYTNGDEISYLFTVENTGNVTISDVQINDPMFTTFDPDAGTGTNEVILACEWNTPPRPERVINDGTVDLAPKEKLICSARHLGTLSEQKAGALINRATVEGRSPANMVDVAADSTTPKNVVYGATATVLAQAIAPGITLYKTVSPEFFNVGTKLTFTLVAENTGNQPMDNVVISDQMPGSGGVTGCTGGRTVDGGVRLLPQEKLTCTLSYTATQADYDDPGRGFIHNDATVTADFIDTDGSATTFVRTASTAAVALPAYGELTLTKTTTPKAYQVGQPVTYTFTVKNTGTARMDNVTIDDPMVTDPNVDLGPISNCTIDQDPVTAATNGTATLGSGETMTCTATLNVTQAQLDAGKVFTNTASVSGDPIISGQTPPRYVSPTVTHNLPSVPRNPDLALTQTAAPSPYDAGVPIEFTVTTKNTGNLTLSDVTQSHSLPGITLVSCDGDATLAPGDELTCTYSFTPTKQDLVDNRVVTNKVTVTGQPPLTDDQVPTATAETRVPPPPLYVTKTASVDGSTFALGDAITYTITVQNRGEATVADVTVTDPMLTSLTCTKAGSPVPNDGTADLDPGQSLVCSGTHQVTQADIDQPMSAYSADPTQPERSAIRNTASAAGTITVDNQAVPTDSNKARNTIAGPLFAPSVSFAKTAWHVTGAAPNQSYTKVTATDGYVVGETLVFRLAATNTGNVTLRNVTLIDSTAPFSDATLTCKVGATDATNGEITLAPEATATCELTHQVSAADVAAGSIINTATVSAMAPQDPSNPLPKVVPPTPAPGVPDPGTIEIPAAKAELTVTKTASKTADLKAGDKVTFTITATNSGNVPLTGVKVSDESMPDLTLACTVAGVGVANPMAAALDPTQALVCKTSEHTVTQAEVDAGAVVNTASATGTPPRSPELAPVEVTSVIVPATPLRQLDITKVSLDAQGDPLVSYRSGDTITYRFTATNNGNVSIRNVRITDAMAGLSPIGGCTIGGSAATNGTATLSPGQAMVCTATYVATADDAFNGTLVNVAKVSGVAPTPSANPTYSPTVPMTTPSPSAAATQTATAAPVSKLTLTKVATPLNGGVAGDTITFTLNAKNVGNVTLTGVGITDTLTGLSELTCSIDFTAPVDNGSATLKKGETLTCTASYVLTQADVDAGGVTNAATATGTAPLGAPQLQPAANSVTVLPAKDGTLVLTKTANPESFVAGTPITYTLSAANKGSLTLSRVTIADPMPGLSPLSGCQKVAKSGSHQPATNGQTTLAPGEALTCFARYLPTAADVAAGEVRNAATVDATLPAGAGGGAAPQGTVETVTPLGVPAPELTLQESTDKPSFAPGDEVTFTFDLTNTGNQTITDVTIQTTLPGLVPGSCTLTVAGVTNPVTLPVSSMGPGDQLTCTAVHVATQQDADRGSIVNTSTAAGTAPGSGPVTSPPTTATVAGPPRQPLLSLTKTAGPAMFDKVGDRLTFTFVGKNEGNVTAHQVTIADSMAGLSPVGSCVVGGDSVSNGQITLAPGESVTCTATYTVTQADVNVGAITNSATISGSGNATGSTGGVAFADAKSTIKVPGPASTAKINLVKTSSAHYFTAGDQVTFTYQATNLGNVTILKTTINDPLKGLSPVRNCTVDGAAVSNGSAALEPGATMTCTATYTTNLADEKTGYLTSTATSTGVARDTQLPVAPADGTLVLLAKRQARATLKLTASPQRVLQVGEKVTFTFTSRNTGKLDIYRARISGVGISGLSKVGNCRLASAPKRIVKNGTITFKVGDRLTCRATYITTRRDASTGKLGLRGVLTGLAKKRIFTVDPAAPLPARAAARAADPELPGTELTTIEVNAVDHVSIRVKRSTPRPPDSTDLPSSGYRVPAQRLRSLG